MAWGGAAEGQARPDHNVGAAALLQRLHLDHKAAPGRGQRAARLLLWGQLSVKCLSIPHILSSLQKHSANSKAGCTLVVTSLNVTQGASILGAQGPNPNAGGQQLATSYITTITP